MTNQINQSDVDFINNALNSARKKKESKSYKKQFQFVFFIIIVFAHGILAGYYVVDRANNPNISNQNGIYLTNDSNLNLIISTPVGQEDIKLRYWSDLSRDEREKIKLEAIKLFPNTINNLGKGV